MLRRIVFLEDKRQMNFCQKPKFNLGKLVATPGSIDVLAKSQQSAESFLRKHQMGNWGDICREDAELNNQAIAHEGHPEEQSRVLSSYKVGANSIWIITEWDRSVTTVLLPSEY